MALEWLVAARVELIPGADFSDLISSRANLEPMSKNPYAAPSADVSPAGTVAAVTVHRSLTQFARETFLAWEKHRDLREMVGLWPAMAARGHVL